MMVNSFVGVLILSSYVVLTVLSAFQTLLVLNLTSGGSHVISAVVFEKANLENCKETIEALILNRYDDTNTRKHTDRMIQNADQNADRMIDALKNK